MLDEISLKTEKTGVWTVFKYITKKDKNLNQITTVLFGGEAGDGAREAGANFGRLLARLGFEVIYLKTVQTPVFSVFNDISSSIN